MKAKKENKVYRITEDQKKRYLAEGYDIYDEEGNVQEYSPLKKIPFGEYMKAVQEIGKLRERITELETLTDTKQEKEPEKKAGSKKAGE